LVILKLNKSPSPLFAKRGTAMDISILND